MGLSYAVHIRFVPGVATPDLRVGIRRIKGGAFSSWANQHLKIGDILEAMKPQGRFYREIEPHAAHHYVGFAGGSGITPIISLIKTVLKEEPKAHFTLVYGNRSVNTVMFRQELGDLKSALFTAPEYRPCARNQGRYRYVHRPHR